MHVPFSSSSRNHRAGVLALVGFVLSALVLTTAPAAAEPAVLSGFPLFASLTPNDFLYPLQWGLPHVDAPLAWDVELGDPSVLVAVVDTGVWWTHEDIGANMWTNTDGTHGYDFIDGDTNPMDEDSTGGTFHGTGVAGVIGALTDNRDDIAGAAQVSVMALRALGSNGEGTSFNASQAIRWAADRGANVINLSLGTNDTFGGPTDMQLAINYAFSRGALIVAAAGNGGGDNIGDPALDFPARLANVVSVAALDSDGSRASYSNYGTGLDISAPGTDIWTLTSNDNAHALSGTSLAAPFVSAAAALLWSLEPRLTNLEVWNILNETAAPIGSRYNTNYGWGEVNYWNLVNALNRPLISVNSRPSVVARSSAIPIGWSVLGPTGLPVTNTHVEWGTAPGSLGNATASQSGTTWQQYSDASLRMPEGASILYFRVAADVTVNGTSQRFESQELSVAVSTLPEFVQALYDLLSSNLLYLAMFVIALAAIVAFLPQRRARRRRAAYARRVAMPPAVQYVYAPAPGPPPAPPVQAPAQPAYVQPMAVQPAPAQPRYAPPTYAQPVTPAPTPAPAPLAPTKKTCPSCGTAVNAENMFCFFCGHPFR
ncbi:MAG TPA: S8 family serine peptidase [Thermoplasmata archaeon]|nr:S8 family serine peptidase [Thermoplasmata archaeon]